jgi:hypothetical protein
LLEFKLPRTVDQKVENEVGSVYPRPYLSREEDKWRIQRAGPAFEDVGVEGETVAFGNPGSECTESRAVGTEMDFERFTEVLDEETDISALTSEDEEIDELDPDQY